MRRRRSQWTDGAIRAPFFSALTGVRRSPFESSRDATPLPRASQVAGAMAARAILLAHASRAREPYCKGRKCSRLTPDAFDVNSLWPTVASEMEQRVVREE